MMAAPMMPTTVAGRTRAQLLEHLSTGADCTLALFGRRAEWRPSETGPTKRVCCVEMHCSMRIPPSQLALSVMSAQKIPTVVAGRTLAQEQRLTAADGTLALFARRAETGP